MTDPAQVPARDDPDRDVEAEQTLARLYQDRVADVCADIMDGLAVLFRGAMTDPASLDLAADIKERATATLHGTLQAMAAGRSLATLGPDIEKVARLRREQQISQEMIFAGYQVIQRTVFDRIVQDCRSRADAGRLISALALRQLEFQWLVTERVAAAFDAGPDAVRRGREQSMQDVLDHLLGRRTGDDPTPRHAETYGLLHPLDHLAVTVPLDDETAVRAVSQANPWAVVGRLDRRAVVIGRGRPVDVGVPWGGCPLTAEALARPEELATRHAEAAACADVVARLGLDSGDVDGLAPFVAVAALPPARRDAFLAACFGPVWGSPRQDELLRAVAASARTGRREAAAELHVHPNTLDYRLSRFRELTGLDLRDPVDRMRCDLGLFLAGLTRR